jgi:hypothetical protein
MVKGPLKEFLFDRDPNKPGFQTPRDINTFDILFGPRGPNIGLDDDIEDDPDTDERIKQALESGQMQPGDFNVEVGEFGTFRPGEGFSDREALARPETGLSKALDDLVGKVVEIGSKVGPVVLGGPAGGALGLGLLANRGAEFLQDRANTFEDQPGVTIPVEGEVSDTDKPVPDFLVNEARLGREAEADRLAGGTTQTGFDRTVEQGPPTTDRFLDTHPQDFQAPDVTATVDVGDVGGSGAGGGTAPSPEDFGLNSPFAEGGNVTKDNSPFANRYQEGGPVSPGGPVAPQPELIQEPTAAPPQAKQDDIPKKLQEGDFVINAAAVELAGKVDLAKIIKEATAAAKKAGIQIVQEAPIQEEGAVDAKVSNGEIIIPNAIVPFIGLEKLEKINNRGQERTAQAQEQQQPQGMPPQQQGFVDGGTVKDVFGKLGDFGGVAGLPSVNDFLKRFNIKDGSAQEEALQTRDLEQEQKEIEDRPQENPVKGLEPTPTGNVDTFLKELTAGERTPGEKPKLSKDDNIRNITNNILQKEGGDKFTNNPLDRGGPTKFGVTQNTLSDFLGRTATVGDVRDLDEQTAREIIRRVGVMTPRVLDLPEGIQSQMADFAVNSGPGNAARSLQRAINKLIDNDVRVDGVVGSDTISAAKKINQEALNNALAQERVKFLEGGFKSGKINQKEFGKGLIDRATSFVRGN